MTTSVTTTKTDFRVLSREAFATVRESILTGHRALFSQRAFRTGEILCSFSDRGVFSQPARLTLQTGLDEHILLFPEFLQYINHSCAPNIFFDTTSRQVICLTDIQEGKEIVFFYPSTEWDMADAFSCRCGASNCLQQIRGAAYLPPEILSQYRLTNFIQQQLRHQTAVAKI
ncbi:MAG: SET domain-containing protein-lysine N-methyltransferase [Acidobacteria bacterium]|nr:SET domain-containing protein-lysine N-methyltransferase [Acidobacteriota bacterium]